MDRLAQLNPAQRLAVQTHEGPLLVLAGAGTGKTRVITYRMAELIRRGTSPNRILSVTFTNKAAREMLERTRAILGRQIRCKPLVCTFHSFCVRVLREEATAIGYPTHFVIYDRGDQESVARTVLRDLRVLDKSLRPGDLLQIISRWKMAGIGPQRAADVAESDLEYLAALAYRKYQAKLKASAAVDFDDLLLLTNQLFAERPDILERHQNRFDYVQIDEYQDTNAVQFQLAEALVRPHRNLCAVGDDDQSIYSWRGADVSHILNFQAQFPEAKVIRLEINYRCTDRILELANRLIRFNRQRHNKTLIAQKKSPHPVRLLRFPTEEDEARGVVQEIRDLIRNRQAAPEDIAILFRTNEQPRLFETELRRARVPYTLIGSQSFFDRREIRDLLAYLKAVANADDEVSLLRIVNTPPRGIGTTTVQKLVQHAVRTGVSFWEAVEQLGDEGQIPAKAFAALRQLKDLLRQFHDRMEGEPERLPELVRELVEQVDYRSEIERTYKSIEQQEARWASVEQLINAAASYVEETEQPSLLEFLEEIALLGREEESDKDDRLAQSNVKLLTLHSAKGLEFPRVYLVGLEEGLLPHRKSIAADESAIEEERRLAYVGVTRAMDHLTLTYAASRMKWGKRRQVFPSRFLWEMRGESAPEELLAEAIEAGSGRRTARR